MVWDEHVRMGAVVVHKQHLLSVTLVEIVVPATQIRSIPQRLRISCKRGLAYDLSQVSEGPRALNEQTAHLAHLTVKLRGRTEAPDGAEGAQFLSARGAKPQTHHEPLQRLLGAFATALMAF
jgi:hypothetical protein